MVYVLVLVLVVHALVLTLVELLNSPHALLPASQLVQCTSDKTCLLPFTIPRAFQTPADLCGGRVTPVGFAKGCSPG